MVVSIKIVVYSVRLALISRLSALHDRIYDVDALDEGGVT